MRVAVHQDDGTVFAYRLGDVTEGHHNLNVVTGEITDIATVLHGLAAQAKLEYPDHKVVIERLVDQGDGTSKWVANNAEAKIPQPESIVAPPLSKDGE